MKISSNGLKEEKSIHRNGKPIARAPMMRTRCKRIRVHLNGWRSCGSSFSWAVVSSA